MDGVAKPPTSTARLVCTVARHSMHTTVRGSPHPTRRALPLACLDFVAHTSLQKACVVPFVVRLGQSCGDSHLYISSECKVLPPPLFIPSVLIANTRNAVHLYGLCFRLDQRLSCIARGPALSRHGLQQRELRRALPANEKGAHDASSIWRAADMRLDFVLAPEPLWRCNNPAVSSEVACFAGAEA
ncbi:hypothetical protein GQ54DRAFT_69057 [Martensiomyces pterosporus]|nr:hypothetical protein GQ54DRAFT_69057 [Martensiomyces pterosporus]